MVKFEHNKLVFSEMFTDKNGKTSLSKVSGFLCILVGLLVFVCSGVMLVAIIHATTKYEGIDFNAILGVLQNMILQSLALITLGTSMVITNRVTKDAAIPQDTEQPKE